jgi:hypothetical protein
LTTILKYNIRAGLLWFILIVLSSGSSLAQHGGELSDSSNLSYQILPVAWYVPETGFTVGLTGISTFRLKGEPKTSRASAINFDAAVTMRGKVFAFVPFEIYKNNEKYRLKGEVGMYKYQYSFYGIGTNSQKVDKEKYNVLFPRLVFNLSRQVTGPVFLGIGYRFDHFDITKIEDEGILSNERPLGVDGGTISNLFLSFLLDSRDHIFDTRKGYYIETFLEKSTPYFGASYTYQKIETDLRYFHIVHPKVVLAHNVYFTKMIGDVPFFTMPYLSTSRRGRGFADRRFMDKTLLNFQSELRFPLFWRIEGAVMASAGVVGPSITGLDFNDLKWAYGAGFRYIVNQEERNKIRLDLGFTGEDFNFYITANEAF